MLIQGVFRYNDKVKQFLLNAIKKLPYMRINDSKSGPFDPIKFVENEAVHEIVYSMRSREF